MATYYFNSNDLRARLNKTACWTHTEALQLSKNLKYEGRIDDCRLADLSLVVAYLEVMECYTPITSDDDDFNCISETEAEQIFENIAKITGLCFIPKNAEYRVVTADDNNQFTQPTLTSGSAITMVGGTPIYYGFLSKDSLIRT